MYTINIIILVILIAALILFTLATFGVPQSKIAPVAAGLALLTLGALVWFLKMSSI